MLKLDRERHFIVKMALVAQTPPPPLGSTHADVLACDGLGHSTRNEITDAIDTRMVY